MGTALETSAPQRRREHSGHPCEIDSRRHSWKIVETEFLQLDVDGDGVAQAAAMLSAVQNLTAASATATKARDKAEMEERRKERAAKAAKVRP